MRRIVIVCRVQTEKVNYRAPSILDQFNFPSSGDDSDSDHDSLQEQKSDEESEQNDAEIDTHEQNDAQIYTQMEPEQINSSDGDEDFLG